MFHVSRLTLECDGVVTVSDDALEPESSKAFRNWFAKIEKKLYVVGPLLPKEHEVSISEVSAFLSRMQEIYGEHSVLYVCGPVIFVHTVLNDIFC